MNVCLFGTGVSSVDIINFFKELNFDKELFRGAISNRLIALKNLQKNKKFDEDFIELARSVYFSNDKRSKIKFEVNNKFGSKIIEVKSYKKY